MEAVRKPKFAFTIFENNRRGELIAATHILDVLGTAAAAAARTAQPA